MVPTNKLGKYFSSNHTSEEYIKVYEENADYFNELASSGRSEDVELALSAKLLKYAVALRKEYYYSKCIRVLDEVSKQLPLIEGNAKLHDECVETYLFSMGVCLRQLKKFKDSNVFFKALTERYPEKQLYHEWFKSNKVNIVTSKTRPAYYALFAVGLLFLAVAYFGYSSIWVRRIGEWGTVAGLAIFVVDTIIVHIINRRNRG